MHSIKTRYTGQLGTHSEHLPSKSFIITDAPLDNNGKGQAFSPTDTLAMALGTCMMTVMAIAGEAEGWDMSGMHLETEKIMAANPRRIAIVHINFYWDNCALNEKQRERIKRIGRTCPVALSLHPEVKQEVIYHF